MHDIQEIFIKISEKMINDFEETQAAIVHSGQKGTINESIVAEFLKKYLPKHLDISTGILVDENGTQTKQIDIIISDAYKTPILFEKANIRVMPIECVYAVIEVKTFLDKNELIKSKENMESVKDLQKSAFYIQDSPIKKTHKLYGKDFDVWPIHYFVFAFDGNKLINLVNELEELQKNKAIEKRIDSICILKKGIILNKTKNSYSAIPEPESILVGHETPKALLLFHAIVSHYLLQAEMPPFKLLAYLKNINY